MFHIVWSKNYWIAGESRSSTISSVAKRNIVLPEPPDFAFSVLPTSTTAAAPPIPVGLVQSRDSGGRHAEDSPATCGFGVSARMAVLMSAQDGSLIGLLDHKVGLYGSP